MPSGRETAVSMPLTPSRSDLYWRRIFEKVRIPKAINNNNRVKFKTGAKPVLLLYLLFTIYCYLLCADFALP